MLTHCFIPETNVVITLEISYTTNEKKKKTPRNKEWGKEVLEVDAKEEVLKRERITF